MKEVKNTCGDLTPAKCVQYKGFIPVFSKLEDKQCVSAEETISDNYKLVESIKDSIDISEDYTSFGVPTSQDPYFKKQGRHKVKDVLNVLVTKLREMESSEDEGDDTLELDFKCLTSSSCGEPISSLKDLLQTLIDEVCKLKTN